MAIVPAEVAGVLAAIEGSDRFLVQQVFKPIANEYRISVPAPGSVEEGESVLFVKQKRMKIKEDIRFRPGPDDGPHVFMIKSKSVFEFRGRHDVLDAEERVIGGLGKLFGRSLLRSRWQGGFSAARCSPAPGRSSTPTATSSSTPTRPAGSSRCCAASRTSGQTGWGF